MTEFKPLETLEFPRVGAPITEENLYWKKLGVRMKSNRMFNKICSLKLEQFI